VAKNYTSDEIEAAVTKLVRDAIRKPYGVLGNRETGTTFNDLQDAAAGVFLLTPAAPYYVVLLATRRLSEELTALSTLVDELVDAAVSTSRRVAPLDSLTSLVNARVALGALETAAAARTSGFTALGEVPAFKRYDVNVTRYLSQVGSSIRVGQNIVQTPQEARAAIPTLLRSVTEQHAEVVRRAELLAVAIADYTSLNLGQLLAAAVITKAREVLQTRVEELEALTPAMRPGILREVTLDVLAGRATVEGFGASPEVTTFVPLSGTGSVYADGAHPATAAVLPSQTLGPYVLVPGDTALSFTVDGGTAVTLSLRASYVAALEGTWVEPYDIWGPSNPPPVGAVRNDHLVISVEGYSDIDLLLTQASGVSVESIVTQINAAITTQPVVAEPYFNPTKFFGLVDLDATGSANDMDFVFPLAGQDWTALGVQVGNKVVVNDGSSVNDGAVYAVVTVSATTLSCSQLAGPAPTDEVNINVEVGAASRYVRIRISDGNEATSLAVSRKLSLPETTDPAYYALGFSPLQEVRCRRTTAAEVAAGVNTDFGAQVAGVARLSALAVFVPSSTVRGRSEPTNPLQIGFHTWYGRASYTAGTSAVFTLLSTINGALSEVVVGDKVVLRTAATYSDIGLVGTVTNVGDGTFVATFSVGVTLSTDSTVEVGPALAVVRDDTLRVLEGSVNQGDYAATAANTDPLLVTVDRPLVVYQTLGGLPAFFDLTLGSFRVDFYSTSTDVDTGLELVVGGASSILFPSPAPAVFGSTPYLQLPSAPKGLEVGDIVEVHSTTYASPTSTHAVVGLELSQLLIEVTPAISVEQGSLLFGAESVPFVRIRKTQQDNYAQFATRLTEWLALPQNAPAFFRELSRLLNPLLANTNPTAADVSAVRAQLLNLAGVLTIVGAEAVSIDPEDSLESILAGYVAAAVPQVDTLLAAFRQKGADKATAVLLEGRFQDFFGMAPQESSYLGAALQAIRDVQRSDLPVRRTDRQEAAQQSVLIASYEEPDADFNYSEAEDLADVSIPGQYTDPGSGSSY